MVDYYREQNDILLKSLIETNINMNISIFYEKQDSYKAIKELTYHIGNVGVELKEGNENREDIELAAFTYNDAKYIRKEIQINNEDIYYLYIYINLYADNIIYEHKNGHITTSYDVKGSKNMHVKLRLPGEFSVYNSLCAIAVTEHLDVDDGLLEKALYNVKVPGRVEPVKISDDFTVMVDYAHNAMSLESLLRTLREYNPHRIVTVFGCGGNRSRQRRFEMGEISGKMSDFTVITSDNPRNEEPDMIMQDIETGIAKTAGRYVKIADRAEAIKYAIDNAEKGDIIVVAGKGHEDYQEIKGVKYHMSDRELILKAAGKMN